MAESEGFFLMYNMTKVDIYISSGNYDEAYNTVENVASKYLYSCIVNYVNAKLLAQNKNYAEALNELEKTSPLTG